MAKQEHKNTTVELRGKVKWAKVFEENRDMNGPNGVWKDDEGRYTITLVVDDISKAALKEAGSQKRVKEDSEGDKVVQIERKHKAPFTYGGPPRVVHADTSPWSLEDDGLIGNGSECIVFATVYEAGGLKGTRLEVVQVIDHVEYESEYDPTSKFNLKDHSTPTPAKASPKKASKKKSDIEELEDDDVPF